MKNKTYFIIFLVIFILLGIVLGIIIAQLISIFGLTMSGLGSGNLCLELINLPGVFDLILCFDTMYNFLSSIALGIEFGISMDDLIKSVSKVRAVPHRLELKKLSNFYQIDDAYNSNPIGAKNACEVLSMMPGIKVVVTPGMIELGEKEDELNKEFGEEIADVADYVVLVGEKQTLPIMQGLTDKGFDKDKILVLNDIRDAYPFIQGLVKKEDVYALFENDLPDTYNE